MFSLKFLPNIRSNKSLKRVSILAGVVGVYFKNCNAIENFVMVDILDNIVYRIFEPTSY